MAVAIGLSLGAILIGGIIAAMAMDTLHMILIMHAVYHYAVETYGVRDALDAPVWSVMRLSTRADFEKDMERYYRAESRVVEIVFFQLLSAQPQQQLAHYLYVAFAGVISSDVLIAGSFIVSLSKYRTGFKNTNTVVNTVLIYSINSTAFTTLCAIGCTVASVGWPQTMVYLALIFSLSKLYICSLLAALNSRQALWEKCFGGVVFSSTQRSSGFRHIAYTNSDTLRIPDVTSISVSVEKVVDAEYSKTDVDHDIEMQTKGA
ncbi:hypothetical protein H0H93_006483 [Arthromyces matolae]|nr:hypothetical protein H0H93_006483 [Arthromyces matolae]